MSDTPRGDAGPSLLGTTLGGYRLLREIGRGGMGAVYYAEHARIVRQAAVKVLLPGVARSPDALERFFREARSASMVAHPAIIDVLDCDVDGSGTAYIVMEHLEGTSLQGFVKPGAPLEPATVIDIGSQIASGMAAAHASDIVHRDLKPDNVFLLEGGMGPSGRRVKLLDFGIAKLLDSEQGPGLTSEGVVIGTPRYMSPEQCQGSRDLGPATDIYSLGCVLFEMACGRPPFVGSTVTELLIAHVSKTPPRPRDLAGRVPEAMEALIVEMLAKRPEERPSGMQEVERRLREAPLTVAPTILTAPTEPFVAGATTAPTTPSRPATAAIAAPPSARAWTRPVAVAAGVLVLLAIAASWFLVRGREARRAEAAAARARIDAALTQAGEVAPPAECRASDPAALARLAAALSALQPAAGSADAGAIQALAEPASPASPEEWAMQARAHLTAGRDGQALEAARRAAEQCPHYAAAHYLAGKSADRLGRGEEAAEAYRRALAANESFMPPRYNLALLQLKGGDPAAAAATLAPLSALADVRVLLLRAQARLDTADLPGAEADLRELLRLEPRHADGWALLGTVYARKNDYAEAMRAFCRGKELGSAAASANCRD